MSARPRFEDLYAEAAPALFAWARVRIQPALRGRLDPEDLVQEVCVRAFEGFPRWEPARGPFRAWLFGIGHHVLQGALVDLGRGRRQGAGETRALDTAPDGATSVTRRVARDEALAAFCTWVDGLDAQDRALLVARGLEGRPHAEVAQGLGIDEEVAKKRWQRLQERIRARGGPAGLALGPPDPGGG